MKLIVAEIGSACSAALRCGFLTCLHFVQQTWNRVIYVGLKRKTSPPRGFSGAQHETCIALHPAFFAHLACRALSSQAAGLQEMFMLLCPARSQGQVSHTIAYSIGPWRSFASSKSSWHNGASRVFFVPMQKLVQEVPFVCLQKWDRNSVRLISGKALDLRKQKDDAGTLDCSAFHELLQLRQERANELLQEALKEEETENATNKKGKPVRAQSKHAVMLPLSMEWISPAER